MLKNAFYFFSPSRSKSTKNQILFYFAIGAIALTLKADAMAQWFYNPATSHYYKATDGVASWSSVEGEATSIGLHLVAINSSAENAWLVSTFNTFSDVWIGLTDSGHEGTFTWSNGDPLTYTNWDASPAEPNGGTEENFVELYLIGGSAGEWNDLNETDSSRHGIIESLVPEPSLFALLITGGIAFTSVRGRRNL